LKDFAFFEYAPRETSDAVVDLFKGFTGYVQADAKSIYDVLYPAPNAEPSDDDCAELGCWSDARRCCASTTTPASENCAASRSVASRGSSSAATITRRPPQRSSPHAWAQTRARLDKAQLAMQIGPLTLPPPPITTG